ncbi:substrate-binding domain-containing protein [Streptacidiphilus rugosus]|uniref:substrate-binding domain-containing protein n=1 Tax=Streptacidiphilus rugosus TaxID=405783 RepID=UPI000689B540|nr:substrate-binding domain-containing protein [Streptacidiphilus rugosus]
MRATAELRHRQILGLLRERPSLRVGDLAAELGVSAATARRDVEALAAAGLLDRVHGRVSRPRDDAAAPEAGPGADPPVVGMLLPVADYYYAEVIRGARAAAARAGVRLVLGISHYSPEADRVQLAALAESGAAGLLLTPSWPEGLPDAADERRILQLGLPAVLLERRAGPGTALAGLDRVCTAHNEGAGLAVRHLARLGRRRIGLLARSETPTARHLAGGYAAAMAALGLEPLVLDLPGPHARDATSDGQVVAEVRRAGLDAALVHTDEDALRLLQALHRHGLRVPDDLALVAYDDEVAALADVPLTAVAPPKRQLGETAVSLLLTRLGAPGGGAFGGACGEGGARRHLDLLPSLRVRVSCGDTPEPAGVPTPLREHVLS